MVATAQRIQRRRSVGGQVPVAFRDEEIDHPLEAEALAVGGGEDPPHAVRLELLDLLRDDDAPAAAVDQHVGAALGPEPIHQVPEVLDVAALVGAHRDPLHVLLDRRADHLVHRAVVPEVDDLGALGLEEAPHDADGGIVPVEQAGRGHEPDRMDQSVEIAHAETG